MKYTYTKLLVRYSIAILFTLHSCESKPEFTVEPGACQLEEYISKIQGKRIGVMVNHTSMLNEIHLVDTLLTLNQNIIKIFSPEHGFKGNAEDGAYLNDDTYSDKNIPVISLYGNKRKPTKSDLHGIEIMLFDLQDVGVRFYTYISSLHYIMEACAENSISLFVLDRPNPNGHYVDGPVLNTDFRSFIGMHPVPVVYGMTIGEYAKMINGEKWLSDSLQCDLYVVPCVNYTHTTFYSLPVAPSPNLKSMEAIYLYPSTCFFEGTVVSEGRGTDAPFQLIGHPDYSVREHSFTPRSIPGASINPKFKGELCFGIDLRNLPRDSLIVRDYINLDYLFTFYNDLNLGNDFFTSYFDLLAGSDNMRKQILQGIGEEEIRNSWKQEAKVFKEIRAKYLLYPDFK